MSNNISSIDEARSKKRDKTGWTMEEIKEKAKKELEEYNNVSEEEPDELISGDMEKIIRGEDDDE
jgi:hypothetical protein